MSDTSIPPLHITPGPDGAVTVRVGQAEPIHTPKPLSLSGNFHAPVEFVQKRYSDEYERLDRFDREECHVIFNKENLSIHLVAGEQERDTITVTGKLKKVKLLEDLKINKSSFTPSELLKVIVHKGHLFDSRENHRQLVHLLRNIDVKTTTEIKTADDRAGSRASSVSEKADSKLAGFQVTMNLPLFEGGEPAVIKFTLEVEPNNGTVQIYPVSETFDEFYETAVDALFDGVRAVFEPFVIIEQ